jgi:hypothetical protein
LRGSKQTECWPQCPYNQLVLLGLGNTALCPQDWQAAEAGFRKPADTASGPVPALNNPALTLDAQRRIVLAMEVAALAVRLGGPFTAQRRNTLAALVEKTRDDDERNR